MGEGKKVDGGQRPEMAKLGAIKLVTSCYETSLELLGRYPQSAAVVHEIYQRGGRILFGVDATSLAPTLSKAMKQYKDPNPVRCAEETLNQLIFDRVIWNFPHAMDQNKDPMVNRQLCSKFFKSSAALLGRS